MDSRTRSSNKSIFIIKATPDSLYAAETWLRNKGWTVHSSVSLKEAVAHILQYRPKNIVICMDHPNAKVRMLPKLLECRLSDAGDLLRRRDGVGIDLNHSDDGICSLSAGQRDDD